MIRSLALCEVEPHVREDLDRGIEQRRPFDPLRVQSRELEDQPAAEGVAHEGCAPHACRIERLEDVVRVRGNRPRRVPVRVAMAAEVRGEDAEPVCQMLLGEPAKPAAVRVDAVKADQCGGARLAPFVHVQLHTREILHVMLALLYDIHGSLPALAAVLDDAREADADGYLLGGDYGAWGPRPLECLERLRALPRTTWIRGNGERWTREPPLDRPEVVETLRERASGYGSEEGWLYSLQERVELDGVLY